MRLGLDAFVGLSLGLGMGNIDGNMTEVVLTLSGLLKGRVGSSLLFDLPNVPNGGSSSTRDSSIVKADTSCQD